jgi:hypothetical protein
VKGAIVFPLRSRACEPLNRSACLGLSKVFRQPVYLEAEQELARFLHEIDGTVDLKLGRDPNMGAGRTKSIILRFQGDAA